MPVDRLEINKYLSQVVTLAERRGACPVQAFGDACQRIMIEVEAGVDPLFRRLIDEGISRSFAPPANPLFQGCDPRSATTGGRAASTSGIGGAQ